MEIEVEKLDTTGESFDHVYEPGEILLDEEHARLVEPPEVHGRAVRKGEKVIISGSIQARAEIDCDRCLRSIEAPLSTNFDVTYAPGSLLDTETAHELNEDELDFSVIDAGVIDVDELVREQMLLSLPSRALCAEECKGLCPTCGADLNEIESCGCESTQIDPRWAALKNFK